MYSVPDFSTKEEILDSKQGLCTVVIFFYEVGHKKGNLIDNSADVHTGHKQ